MIGHPHDLRPAMPRGSQCNGTPVQHRLQGYPRVNLRRRRLHLPIMPVCQPLDGNQMNLLANSPRPLMGQMMDMPLMISSLLVHAARHSADTEIVSKRVEGDIHRYTYKDAELRARKLAQALARLGCEPGDRVGTLAWNGYRHFEIYYATSGSQLVCHTINPRLFPEQIVWIASDAADKVLCFELNFLPLVEKLVAQLPSVAALRADDRPRPHAGIDDDSRPALLRRAGRSRRRQLPVAAVRRKHRIEHLLHVGNDRQSERRGLQPPLDAAAQFRPGDARCDGRQLARRDPAGGADVPRQRLGRAVCGADDRRQAGLPRPASRRQIAVRADGKRAGDLQRRRADRLARA